MNKVRKTGFAGERKCFSIVMRRLYAKIIVEYTDKRSPELTYGPT